MWQVLTDLNILFQSRVHTSILLRNFVRRLAAVFKSFLFNIFLIMIHLIIKQFTFANNECEKWSNLYPVSAGRCTPSNTDKIFSRYFMTVLVTNQKCNWCQFNWLRGYFGCSNGSYFITNLTQPNCRCYI